MVVMLTAAAARPGIRRVLQLALVLASFVLVYHLILHHKRLFKTKNQIVLQHQPNAATRVQTPTSRTSHSSNLSQSVAKKARKRTNLELDENGQYYKEEVRKVIANGYSPGSRETKLVRMEHCNCDREIELSSTTTSTSTDGLPYDLTNTTCSADAFTRGSGQRVVGFSFYGDMDSDKFKLKGYYEGIVGNLDLMKEFYPGWTMRLYFDLDDQHPVKKDICDLACANPLLDLCHAGKLPGTPMVDARKVFPMNWRFFPTIDPQVDMMVSRDLDSKPSWREAAAVAEWMSSGRSLHCMRDHPDHGLPLVGSAWGARLDLATGRRARWKTAFVRAARIRPNTMFANRTDYGPDQEILMRFVWPWAKKDAICHDSYHCHLFENAEPFPTKRIDKENNFVAAVTNLKEVMSQVDVFVCRDLDSRFSWREASAVADWLLSDQPIHSMRDHTAHFAPLVGASWGSHQLRKDARPRWRKSWSKILSSTIGWAARNKSGPDQEALQFYVWPWGRHNSVQHDAYLCERFPGSVPFPTRRLKEPNNHVAAVVVDNATYWDRCPHVCRPKLHQDWAQC